MNILDIIIIFILLIGAVVGFKRGGIKTAISFVGLIIVTLAAFSLKNVISNILYTFCPFFEFKGVLKGITVINILLYEMIAFLIIFVILYGVLKIVIFISGIVETLLKMTIVLSIPSKILGAILGLIENYLVVFIILYFMTFPFFNIDFINNSTLKDKILDNTPLLSYYVKSNVSINTELVKLMDAYKNKNEQNSFNLDTLDLLLKYEVVDVKTVRKLVDKKKLQIDNIDYILNKYND